jgi:hypothetical protein
MISPALLDAAINGVKVYINRRPDGSVYGTVHDFERFGVKPLKIVRVPLDFPDPENHPDVHRAVGKAME